MMFLHVSTICVSMFLNILLGGAFSFSRLVGFSEHFVAAMGAMSGCSLCRSAAGGGSPGCHRKVSTDESTQERSKFLRGCLPGSTYHRPNTFFMAAFADVFGGQRQIRSEDSEG